MLHNQKANQTMMISEMIKLLQEEIDLVGDVPIFFQYDPEDGDGWGKYVDIYALRSCIIGAVRCVTIEPSEECEYDFTNSNLFKSAVKPLPLGMGI